MVIMCYEDFIKKQRTIKLELMRILLIVYKLTFIVILIWSIINQDIDYLSVYGNGTSLIKLSLIFLFSCSIIF